MTPGPSRNPLKTRRLLQLAVVLAVGCVLWATVPERLPAAGGEDHAAKGAAEISGHDHDDEDGDDHEVVRLSEQARGTIGLRTAEVSPSTFDRSITVPGVVTERPGRSVLQVAAPMSGIVTDIFVTEGEAVAPGDPLFVLRLTHQDLVRAQTEFLTTREALDVESREVARLAGLPSGLVARTRVLDREYEKQKLEGRLKAQRQSLLLHGLTPQQVDRIVETRDLVYEVRVDVPEPHRVDEEGHLVQHAVAGGAEAGTATPDGFAPAVPPDPGHDHEPPPLSVERLTARAGRAVEAGEPLAVLNDLRTLRVEGRAFESDARAIARAVREELPVEIRSADASNRGGEADVAELRIDYVANRVDSESRALLFYVLLPNERLADDAGLPGLGKTPRPWRFKPGQRVRLRVPVERFEDAIVLPIEAVAEAGTERFAFVEREGGFERRPVRVAFRDESRVVIAADGSLAPGETVAVTAAHQLQMALKNAGGGGADPHAGHGH